MLIEQEFRHLGAAMGIYMDFDGIKGEATQEDHKWWIDVLSLTWGTGRSIDTASRDTQNREATEPDLSDVTIIKQFDSASPELFTEACAGNQGKTVKIDITSTGSPSVVFCTYTLSNSVIDGFTVNSSGDRPTESVSISYTKLEFKFTPYDDKLGAGTPTTISYDLATTKSSSVAPNGQSDIDISHESVATDAAPILQRAGQDIFYSYDLVTRTGTIQSGAINLTSRFGSSSNDILFGTAGPEIFNGLDGDDIFRGGPGDDAINGGNGVDTAVFSGLLAEHTVLTGGARYTLSLPAGVYGVEALNIIESSQFNVGPGILRTVIDQVTGRDGVDTLSQVERLRFTDTNLAFDVSRGENAGEAYRLYLSTFDRAPDLGGLGYWIKQIDRGANFKEVANSFISSTEFIKRYGEHITDESFLTNLYQNALHRTPDPAGLKYWLDQLSHGGNRGEVLASVSESIEAVAQAPSLLTTGIQYHEWIG